MFKPLCFFAVSRLNNCVESINLFNLVKPRIMNGGGVRGEWMENCQHLNEVNKNKVLLTVDPAVDKSAWIDFVQRFLTNVTINDFCNLFKVNWTQIDYTGPLLFPIPPPPSGFFIFTRIVLPQGGRSFSKRLNVKTEASTLCVLRSNVFRLL